MARVLVWSPEAIEDLEAIAAYIERDSPWYARAVVTKIVETAESIPQYPELGRIVPELEDAAIRERLVHRYRVIYNLSGTHVTVAAVIHGRRDEARATDDTEREHAGVEREDREPQSRGCREVEEDDGFAVVRPGRPLP